MMTVTSAVLTVTGRVTRGSRSWPVIVDQDGWAIEASVPEGQPVRLWSPGRLAEPDVKLRFMPGRPW